MIKCKRKTAPVTLFAEIMQQTVSLQCLFVYFLFLDILIFTARGYAKRGICRRRVSVCVCVCHSGIVSKRLNEGSRKQRRTIAT